VEPVVVAYEKAAGESFRDKICRIMSECKLFLVLLARNSVTNQWVNQEIGFAKALHRRLIIQTIIPVIERIPGEQNKIQPLNIEGFIGSDTDAASYIESDWENSISNIVEYIHAAQERDKIPEPIRLQQAADDLVSDQMYWEASERLQRLANLYIEQEEISDAIDVILKSVKLLSAGEWHWESAAGMGKVADLYLELNKLNEAINAWQEQSQFYVESGNLWESAQTLEDAAKVLVKRDHNTEATDFLKKAADLYTEGEYDIEASRCVKRIRSINKPQNG